MFEIILGILILVLFLGLGIYLTINSYDTSDRLTFLFGIWLSIVSIVSIVGVIIREVKV